MPNGNQRGSSYDRRARRAWLLSPAAGFGGDGVKVACWECGAMVNDRTLFVDRIIPCHEGGRHRRDNIRPHCATCSHREGQRTKTLLAAERSPYDADDCCKVCGEHYLTKHTKGCANDVEDDW